jgi:Xaa-Pro aminopeptidase
VFTAEEARWLNEYHAEIFEKVSGLLKNDPRALEWLKRECAAI